MATCFVCSVPTVLEDFGVVLVLILVSLYGAFLDPKWRTFDLLSNTESVIHRAVRMREPQDHPPLLRCQRVSDREVHILYTSERRLCAVAIGFCRDVAAYY